MDFSEATKIVFTRIQMIEPELVSKIIGYLLLKTMRHSFSHWRSQSRPPGPRIVSQATGVGPHARRPRCPLQFPSYSPTTARPFSSSLPAFRGPALYWDRQLPQEQQQALHGVDFGPTARYPDGVSEDYLQQAHFLSGLDDSLDPLNPANSGFLVCHYYFKGYCKHGSNCRYYHGQNVLTSQLLSASSNDLVNEDSSISPGSLEKLEHELTELLKSRGGQPISIAMLPMLYFERYGKVLQADGYLTESQRHGKAGFSLTKLLARLKNSIRILDRPHGQHSVVLVEDAGWHSEYRSERGDLGGNVAGPSRSTSPSQPRASSLRRMQFGPVRDVRIPCQQKRMFGFVTFEKQETAQFILSQGNPHFVCGARVLVKPYKEKSRVSDRKYMEKIDHPMHHAPQYLEIDSELYPISRFCNNARLLKKQLLEEHDQALELESLRYPSCGCPRDFTSVDHFSYQPDLMNDSSTNDGRYRNPTNTNSYSDQDSLGLSLPDSPFASASVANSISTVI
ncbi:unnamed protein product [Spirodela intermedia]|uniref:Uncharacterized protein n=1 Tax=Spirodela intermedia TaxID=51605 RepID=A0A7I8IHC7_SPIIN|nr:unnamed protein product [Spirodela intermedia]CAA6657283.1 unnamed protein product [Spirodela intermedia]